MPMTPDERLSAQALTGPTFYPWAMARTKHAARRWAASQYRRRFTVYRRRRILCAILDQSRAARHLNHGRRSFSNLVVHRGRFLHPRAIWWAPSHGIVIQP